MPTLAAKSAAKMGHPVVRGKKQIPRGNERKEGKGKNGRQQVRSLRSE
jgi:hypothetical protein